MNRGDMLVGDPHGGTLAPDHPTALAFLDESGSISQDRFFAAGCLKVTEPSKLVRRIKKLRDRKHRYHEIHFSDLTTGSLGFYREVVDQVAATEECSFACFVADRAAADPVARFGSTWTAYERLATQLLLGSIKPRELVTVLADEYSTPHDVFFEIEVKNEVNRRLGRLGVTSVCRLNSKAADPLQLTDLFTSAVAFEFRAQAGLAGASGPKNELAHHLRQRFGFDSLIAGGSAPRFNVAIYREGGKER